MKIWLGTAIDESMKDEIRVTVVATGVRQDKVEKVMVFVRHHNLLVQAVRVEPNREVQDNEREKLDMTETVEVPAPSRQRTKVQPW